MKRILVSLVFLLVMQSPAWATWSVIAVDRATGRVVIASATCGAGTDPDGLKRTQAVVIPGVGIAACQAAADGTHENHRLIFRELQKGTDPKEIIRMLHADPEIERRQFGIVDLKGRSAGHSGIANGTVSLDAQGQVPGTNIFYSIQGNTLARPDVVNQAVRAFVETAGPIEDRVMAAMDVADSLGGDRKCTCDAEPRPNAPCNGKTAHVAYILIADRNNPLGTSVANAADGRREPFNDGQYTMNISVIPNTIQPFENANPVKTLRMRYNDWKKSTVQQK